MFSDQLMKKEKEQVPKEEDGFFKTLSKFITIQQQ